MWSTNLKFSVVELQCQTIVLLWQQLEAECISRRKRGERNQIKIPISKAFVWDLAPEEVAGNKLRLSHVVLAYYKLLFPLAWLYMHPRLLCAGCTEFRGWAWSPVSPVSIRGDFWPFDFFTEVMAKAVATKYYSDPNYAWSVLQVYFILSSICKVTWGNSVKRYNSGKVFAFSLLFRSFALKLYIYAKIYQYCTHDVRNLWKWSIFNKIK